MKSVESDSEKNIEYKQILTYNGSLSIELEKKRHEALIDYMIEQVKNKKGYVQRQSLNSLSVKIPAQEFKATMSDFKRKAESFGGGISHENVNIINISDAYYDTKIRLENAQKLQQRLTELLKDAKNVDETIKVETELSRVTQQIELLQGRMNLYQNQTDFSTIDVYLTDEIKPGPLGWIFYGAYKVVAWLFIWN